VSTPLQVEEIVHNARVFGEAVDGFLRTLETQIVTGPLEGNAFLRSLQKRVDSVLTERDADLGSIGFTRAGGGIRFDPGLFERALLADAARVAAIVEDARRRIGGLLTAQQEGMVAMMTSVSHGKPAVQLGTVSAQVHHLEERRGSLRNRSTALHRAWDLVASQGERLARHIDQLS
jgi:hypothetical protein